MTLTIEEACELLGVTPVTIRLWKHRGLIAPMREGAKPLLFREDDLQRVRRQTRRDHDAIDAAWRAVVDDRAKP